MAEVATIRLESVFEAEVIWFPGPIPYNLTELSESLMENLLWWHRRIEGETTHEDHFGPFDHPVDVIEAGVQFAQQLADEVGKEFSVELWFEGLRGVYHSEKMATNAAARQAFAAFRANL